MLNGIPKILSSDLLKLLMDMGHGDELVIGDGNFPAAAMGVPVVHLDGHGVPEVLEAILKFFPLDAYVAQPVALMDIIPGDTIVPTIWEKYKESLQAFGYESGMEKMERYAFYNRARRAFCVIATSEPAQYANIILKKGIVK